MSKLLVLREKLRILCTSSYASKATVDDDCASEPDPILRILLIELWKNDSFAVVRALKDLADLCFDDKDRETNRRTVCEAGGHTTVLGVMRRWTNCREIQAEGCRVILNVGMDNPSFCTTAVRIGAFDIVLTAMRGFVKDPYLHKNGCAALHALTRGNYDSAIRLVTDHDGMRTIVYSMNAFYESERLQLWACCLMNDIAQWATLRFHMVEAGAKPALVSAMEAHKETENSLPECLIIQEQARSAMRKLMS